MEADLGQQNIGLTSAWRKAAIRDDWRRIVDTARSSGVCYKRKKKYKELISLNVSLTVTIRPVVSAPWSFLSVSDRL